MVPNVVGELKPLGMTCTSSDCDNDLHCFRLTKKMAVALQPGTCRSCGALLIDMERVQQRDLSDVEHTIASLKRERIRHHFWHVDLDPQAISHARRKGRMGMIEAAERRIRTSVAQPQHPREGRQTPFKGNTLYYAQHAVGACCRACIEEWHGIPRTQPLSEDEITYLVQLLVLYVFERLPHLTEAGEKIPPLRSRYR